MNLDSILSWIFSTYVHLLNLFDIFESIFPCVESEIVIPMPRRIVLNIFKAASITSGSFNTCLKKRVCNIPVIALGIVYQKNRKDRIKPTKVQGDLKNNKKVLKSKNKTSKKIACERVVKEGLLGDAVCKETRWKKGGVLCRYLEQEASRQREESINSICTASVGG